MVLASIPFLRCRNLQHRAQAFTLVELLVLNAIIAIAGLLLPALADLSDRTTDIKSPSKMVTIGDEGAYNPYQTVIKPEFFRHTKYLNFRFDVAFADGHAAFTKFLFQA